MISPKVHRIDKYLLAILSVVMLLHSVSLYALPTEITDEQTSIEATDEFDDQQVQIQAYDALIPNFQGMAPIVLYLIHEVVLLEVCDYQEHPVQLDYQDQFRKVLFPFIISPNAP